MLVTSFFVGMKYLRNSKKKKITVWGVFRKNLIFTLELCYLKRHSWNNIEYLWYIFSSLKFPLRHFYVKSLYFNNSISYYEHNHFWKIQILNLNWTNEMKYFENLILKYDMIRKIRITKVFLTLLTIICYCIDNLFK